MSIKKCSKRQSKGRYIKSYLFRTWIFLWLFIIILFSRNFFNSAWRPSRTSAIKYFFCNHLNLGELTTKRSKRIFWFLTFLKEFGFRIIIVYSLSFLVFYFLLTPLHSFLYEGYSSYMGELLIFKNRSSYFIKEESVFIKNFFLYYPV